MNHATPKKYLKKFIRSLLSATCLTLAGSGVASATTFFESSVGDFPGTSPGTSLPIGTTLVNGSITPATDVDFFEFMGLAAGQSFTLTGSAPSNDFFMSAFNSSNTQFGTAQEMFNNHNAVITGTTPGDGNLIVEIVTSPSEQNAGAYSVSLSAVLAPEPASVALTGIGLAAAAALARRRKTEE